MKKLIKQTKYGASLIALAFSLSMSTNIRAQSCAVPPTCAELGYTRSAAECATASLKCPFDKTKYYCLTADELAAITPPASNCIIGDILYSDKTCNANVVASKTPIGVVFDVTNRLAIAKDTNTLKWSTSYFDVPELANKTSAGAALADRAGRANTTTVTNYCKSSSKSCLAFDYVNSYQTAGTKAGDWYLPAMGELNAIYSNKGVLNTALSKIGGQTLSGWYWSSSERLDDSAWRQYFYDGTIYYYGTKRDDLYVRPVLAF